MVQREREETKTKIHQCELVTTLQKQQLMCGHQTSSENPKPILSSPIQSEEHVSTTRKISVSNYKYFTETSYRNLAYFLLKKILWRGLPGMDFHDLPTFLV